MSKFAKERQDNRMKDYKQSFDADEFKKRREESIISVRRQKREESIFKKRDMENFVEKEDDVQVDFVLKSFFFTSLNTLQVNSSPISQCLQLIPQLVYWICEIQPNNSPKVFKFLQS